MQIMKKAASALVGGGALAVLIALLAPAGTAQAATVPIDLWAKTGSATMPDGQVVTVWGYSLSDTAVDRPGGPVLTVNAGDTVQLTLHNQLSEPTSLLFQGQVMVPDTSGVAAGGTKTYTFTADEPGTYLYEAGLIANGQHQVAMGLYGVLVVNSGTAGQAYGTAASAFDQEAVLLLSEIDPALSNAADPSAFDMRKFKPRYFLINGEAYPDTDPIATTAGNRVLLRYVNAGMDYHSMAVLGVHQSVIALDGSPLNHTRHYVAETFGPGQTADALVTAPAATPEENRIAIYDGSELLHNSRAAGSGGMLTFLTVPGSGSTSDVTGPVTSGLAFAAGTLTGTVDDTATGGADIQAVEYYLDTVAGAPAGSLSAADGSFDSPAEDVTGAVGVPAGQHVLYVRGQDSLGNWGVFSSVLVNGGDEVGPATTDLTLAPNPTNGSEDVTLAATADDTLAGGSTIQAAEYFVDTDPGVGLATALTVNLPATVASLDGTISAATVAGLSEGAHVVSVRSQDSSGNWGPVVATELVVDKTGPDTAGVTAAPDPTNGKVGYNGSIDAVRVTATMSDPVSGLVNSDLRRAEAFIDTVGADGSGIPLRASDGVFDSPSEVGYTDIPLATITQLTDGVHTLYVHAKDAAKNWGATSTVTLLVDKTGPSVTAVTATPNPTNGAAAVVLTATATDALSTVTAAEWFVGGDPGVGNGTPMVVSGSSLSATIDVSTWYQGSYTLKVRARDAVGNWSSVSSTVLVVPFPGLSFSTVGNAGIPGVAGPFDDADIYRWDDTSYTRAFDASAFGLPGGADVDGYDRVDATHFYLSFASANTFVPGIGQVQDEDVVYYDGSSWSVYFNGTAHGLTTNNEDIDGFTVDGGTLYFSTVGNTNPPGVGGAADNADIYSWDGTSYSRVWDATANGIAGAANVDGLALKDPNHFYLSFATNTAVPGLGTVQDEDVVYRNGGSGWLLFFDGTAHGLTTDAHDVDAIDVP
jgi:FtsP/CotA-like multicopper oxidase with cupredoxin domain